MSWTACHFLTSVGESLKQAGFIMRLEGQPLTADLEDFLPDFKFAFEGAGEEAGGFYYTTQRCQELNDHFGDLLHKIRDLEVTHPSQHLFLHATCTVTGAAASARMRAKHTSYELAPINFTLAIPVKSVRRRQHQAACLPFPSASCIFCAAALYLRVARASQHVKQVLYAKRTVDMPHCWLASCRTASASSWSRGSGSMHRSCMRPQLWPRRWIVWLPWPCLRTSTTSAARS